MPIEQVKAILPLFCGVKLIISVVFGCTFLPIFNEGILNDAAQLYASFDTRLKFNGTPCFTLK